MRGNILTQTSWKVKVVFTLTVLFATTCLLLTNLPAQQVEGDHMDWKSKWVFNGDVWIDTSVCAGYNDPFLTSSHCAYVSNNGSVVVECYYEFDAKVTGPGLDDPLEKNLEDHEQAPAGDSWSKSHSFSFDMSGKAGVFTITAFSDLVVKRHPEQDGVHASISTDFDI